MTVQKRLQFFEQSRAEQSRAEQSRAEQSSLKSVRFDFDGISYDGKEACGLFCRDESVEGLQAFCMRTDT